MNTGGLQFQMSVNAEVAARHYASGDYIRAVRDYAMACAYAYSLAEIARSHGDGNEATRMEELAASYSRHCELAHSAIRDILV